MGMNTFGIFIISLNFIYNKFEGIIQLCCDSYRYRVLKVMECAAAAADVYDGDYYYLNLSGFYCVMSTNFAVVSRGNVTVFNTSLYGLFL